MDILFALLAVIVVLAWVFGRGRVQNGERDGYEGYSDYEEGEDDEPIDEDAIRAAEDEFWEKDWEEPEEWGR